LVGCLVGVLENNLRIAKYKSTETFRIVLQDDAVEITCIAL